MADTSTSITVNAWRMCSRLRSRRWIKKFGLANSRPAMANPTIAIPITDTPISDGVRRRDTIAVTMKLLASAK